MEEIFITSIKTQDFPIIGNIEIPLDSKTRKHLIITGKNGSGKTHFLKGLEQKFRDFLSGKLTKYQIQHNIQVLKKSITTREEEIKSLDTTLSTSLGFDKHEMKEGKLRDIESYKKNIEYYKNELQETQKFQIEFSSLKHIEVIKNKDFILAFFRAQRKNQADVPKAITNVDLSLRNPTETEDLHRRFIAYMVRLRTTYLNEKDKAERGYTESREKAEQINKWFNHLENTLKNLFERDDLRLEYDDEGLNYKIMYEDRCFGLNELSDGYSSLLAILTELILRMEAKGFKSYDMQGVVLIDEIETHLHIALQKRVLPFLCDFFPNIQFIVTTHSPFVLSSLENAVICDLQNKVILTEDISGYSYESLTDGYFDTSKYSNLVEKKYQELKTLLQARRARELSNVEVSRLNELEYFFESIPTYQNEELKLRIDRLLEELK